MPSNERLARLKQAVVTKKEERGAEKEDLKRIVTRLRGESSLRTKGAELRERLEGGGEKPLDFKKLDAEKVGGLAGAMFSSFRGPFTKLAQAMSGLPALERARSTLDSAGMKTPPEAYLVAVAVNAVLGAIFGCILFVILGVALNDATLAAISPLVGGAFFILVILAGIFYPIGRASSRAREIDRVLPFALRQLSTQIKAGVSFSKALESVANSNYGVLSEEFGKVLSDLDNGMSNEDALGALSRRTQSKGLRKALTQMIRSFRSGGSLSQIITDIADDVSFETRMSIRDFTERLNFVNIIYIMVAVVAPVGIAIMSAVLQIPMFAAIGIPPYFIDFAFLGILLAMIAILYVTKRMEPAAW
ncbi:MAG: type II secretion system F family protein [Candidatus Micrarchaeota archaeon]